MGSLAWRWFAVTMVWILICLISASALAALRREVTMMSLSKTADHAGLKSRALSLDLNEIRQLKLPCILHWGMNHYVVLTKVRKSSFIVHDPALGKRVIGNQEMSNYFYRYRPGTLAGSKLSNRKKPNLACVCWI